MKQWRNFPGLAAIIAPFAICVAISVAFLLWFGLSTARLLEDSETTKQRESVSLLANYAQHLIDDSIANTDDLATALAAGAAQPVDLTAYHEPRSHIHTRSIVVFDDRGQVLANTAGMSTTLVSQLPGLVARLAQTDTPIFLPEPANDDGDIPGFAIARRLANPRVNFIIDVVINPPERRVTFDLHSFNAAFAMIDIDSGAAVTFGGGHFDSKLQSRLIALAHDPSTQESDDPNNCRAGTLFSRDCATFRRLKNSSLLLAGATDHDLLVGQWVQESRPIWLFAVFVILGGIGSSILVYVWARQRHADRFALSSALEELRLAYDAKSNFMAHLCHELRTPLNSIVGFSDIMRSKLFGALDDRYHTYAEDIHASAVHLHNIATDIMDVERIERGEFALEPGTADLNATIFEVARMLSVLAAKRDVKIELAPSSDAAIVDLSPHRAMQIAVNLISNAVKYSEPGDRAVVSVGRNAEGRLTLTVADEGVGMTEDEIAYSEHPFGHPADRRIGRHDSIGLGLPIVRGLLAGIGGYLHIVSEKHKGTTVTAVFTK